MLCIWHNFSISHFGKESRLIEQENGLLLSLKLLVPSINSHSLGNILICVGKFIVDPFQKFMSSHFLCLLFTSNNIDKPIRCWQLYSFFRWEILALSHCRKRLQDPLMRIIWFLISNKCKTWVHWTKKK